MNDKTAETKRVEALFGPFAGSQMDIATADADAAIADGWARDPFAPPPDPNEPQKEFSAEDHAKVIEAAEKAARKIRGEDQEDELKAKKGAKKGKDTNADTQAAVGKARENQMEAGTDASKGYETRQQTTRKPKAD